MRKNNYAHNKLGQKVFCRTEIAPTGVLVADFYLPQHKFGIIWKRTESVQINGIRETKDKRKDIVTYLVHPSFWMGTSFKDYNYTYKTPQDALNMVFNDFIHLYV